MKIFLLFLRKRNFSGSGRVCMSGRTKSEGNSLKKILSVLSGKSMIY